MYSYGYKSILRTKSNIYTGAFLKKQLNILAKVFPHTCLTGYKSASGSLDAPCEIAPLNSIIQI